MTRIYLGDLAYLSDKDNNQPVPLNIAYLATYVKASLDDIDVEIFRDPQVLLERLKQEPPDILGLSHYDWTANLNVPILKACKEVSQKTLTVMGGPRFNYDDKQWMLNFFGERPFLDAYVAKEGEIAFTRLVEAFNNVNGAIDKLSTQALPSTVFLFDHVRRKLLNNTEIHAPIVEVETIPSPYLSGLLDPFLEDERLVPIIETNRGCPYSCSFCCWGKVQAKISQFSLERIENEIEYILEKSKNKLGFFYVADANFGIFKRDLEIARMFRKANAKFNVLNRLFVYFAKNTNNLVLNVAEELRDLTYLSMTKQTTNKEVLESVNRKNIPTSKHDLLKAECAKRGIRTFSELIYGIPSETCEEFIQGVIDTVGEGHRPTLYWFLLLVGSESDSQEYRFKHKIKTAYRIIPRYVSTYDEIHCLEYEEVMISNSTWSYDDFMKVRSFQFLTTLFGTRIFNLLNRYLSDFSFNYATFAKLVLDDWGKTSPNWKAFLGSFRDACEAELIPKALLQVEFTKTDIDNVSHFGIALIPRFMAQLVSDRALLSELRTHLEDLCLRELPIAKKGRRDLAAVLDATFDNVICYESFEPSKEVDWQYDFDSWVKDLEQRSLVHFKSPRSQKIVYFLPQHIEKEFNELKANNFETVDAVYVLRTNIIGFDSEDVFCYQTKKGVERPLKTE